MLIIGGSIVAVSDSTFYRHVKDEGLEKYLRRHFHDDFCAGKDTDT